MKDYMIRAAAGREEGTEEIRAFAITSKDTVEYARTHHGTAPVVTAALGRMLSGGAMMGMMMKDERDLLTLQVRGDGPIGGITVTADNDGHVKGFANEPVVELPLKRRGKLDVGRAVGKGFLRVLRDTGAKEPYVGTVELMTGEIAEDLTYYFAQSEQTPSAVGLGVLVDTDCTVKCAGGFIVQLLPDASEETVTLLEENIKRLRAVTDMLDDGMTPEDLLKEVLSGMKVTFLETKAVAFVCDCGKERIEGSLAALPKADLVEMIEDQKPIEVRCQFCGKRYMFSAEELEELTGLKKTV